MPIAIDPITAILNVGSRIIDKIFPDKNEAEKVRLRMAEMAMQGQLEDLKASTQLLIEQLAINNQEAKHASWFVAGWRPFVGWVCGSAFAYHYIAQPMMGFFTGWPLPTLDMAELMTILMGILGLGAYRTYEKTRK